MCMFIQFLERINTITKEFRALKTSEANKEDQYS